LGVGGRRCGNGLDAVAISDGKVPRHRRRDDAPRRDGWVITEVGGMWKAVRRGTLNAWQIAYGCELVIYADSAGELELLLTAETIKENMIDLAARLVDGIGEAAEKRRAQAAER
jgi:hypothetical protein